MNDAMPLTRCCIRIRLNKNCRINSLPDELLISILSCLNFHEAARTCILSRRWRYLWKYTSCSIEFYKRGTGVGLAEKLRNSVNQALKSHQGACIEHFKVGFVYPKGFPTECVDGWIDFALTKKVKVFELNLAAFKSKPYGTRYTYSLPNVQKLLSISGELKLLTACTTLKSVRFVDVRITQEVVEFLLSNCPLLETVSISASVSIKNLSVVGSLPKLRSMVISNCENLTAMVINAPSLASFKYIGRIIPVPFKNVPLLTELYLGGRFADSFLLKARKHSNYCRNLRRLKLEVTSQLCRKSKVVPTEVQQFCHLKELELVITARIGDGLCFFTYLIKFCPQLSRLTILLSFLPGPERRDIWGSHLSQDVLIKMVQDKRRADDRAGKKATIFRHECLEVVKIVGFIGSTSDYDLALRLLQIARSLKQMILVSDLGRQSCYKLELFWPLPTMQKASRKCAKKLKANLPPGAELLTDGPGFSRMK